MQFTYFYTVVKINKIIFVWLRFAAAIAHSSHHYFLMYHDHLSMNHDAALSNGPQLTPSIAEGEGFHCGDGNERSLE